MTVVVLLSSDKTTQLQWNSHVVIHGHTHTHTHTLAILFTFTFPLHIYNRCKAYSLFVPLPGMAAQQAKSW